MLATEGVSHVSSRQLAECMKVGDAQVRRDLTLFGQFGRPGVGYDVATLIERVQHILGTSQRWKVIVVGAGQLGHALLGYPGFTQRGFDIVAAFDADDGKVGTQIGDVPVRSMDDLESVVKEAGVVLAMLAVPAEAAQGAADCLAAAGIRGIVNFASARVEVPSDIRVNAVDITAHLEQLSFQVTNTEA